MDNHYHLVLRLGERGLVTRHVRAEHRLCDRTSTPGTVASTICSASGSGTASSKTTRRVVNARALRRLRTRCRPAASARSRRTGVERAIARRSGSAAARHPLARDQVLAVLRPHDRRARIEAYRAALRRRVPRGPRPVAATVTRRALPSYVSCVLGAAAAFGRGQAAALGGDGAALDAVRRGELHLDGAVAVRVADLVDLRRAHVRPQLRQLARDLRLDADVIRLVVARAVARREDARQLVEGQLPVRRRIRLRAVGA